MRKSFPLSPWGRGARGEGMFAPDSVPTIKHRARATTRASTAFCIDSLYRRRVTLTPCPLSPKGRGET